MRNTTHPPTAEETWFPLQWLNLERGTAILRIPAPLLRIHACGMLRVEALCEMRENPTLEGRYQSLSEEQMRGRNGAQALTLLKLLLSRQSRYAPKHYLMEHLGHGEQAIGEGRLDDLVTKLRGLLCSSEWEHVRTHLVQHVHSSAATGNGYRLASYPLIWLDTDAFAWCVEQAVRLERHGEPELACVLWERAYTLASRGDYLGDEQYADWAESKRAEVARGRRASVHALSRLLVATAGAAGEVQVLHLLSAYCAQYPLDEDVLRPLMELLGKHERFGEALALYEHACSLLTEDGLSPDERTSDIAQVLRTKTLHRQRSHEQGASQGQQSLAALSHSHLLSHSFSPPREIPAKETFSLSKERFELINSLSQFGLTLLGVSHLLLTQEAFSPESDELLSGFGIAFLEGNQQKQMSSHLSQMLTHDILEAISQTGEEKQAIDPRRRATIVGLISLLGGTNAGEWLDRLASPVASPITREAFDFFEQLLENGWGLCNVGEWQIAEQVLTSFFSEVIGHAPRQREAALLASKGLVLGSILRAHQLKLPAMIPLCQQAVTYAKTTKDHTALCASLNGLAVAFKYNHRLEESFEAYAQALVYCDSQASSLIRSRIYAGAAAAYARKGRSKEADLYINLARELFPDHPEQDSHFLSADHGWYMIAYYEGLLYIALNQPQKALHAFESYKQRCPEGAVPQRNWLEMRNYQGKAAVLAKKLDLYASCLQDGLAGALVLQSKKRLDEAVAIFREDVPLSWRADPAIKLIIEQYPVLFQEVR